MNQFSLSMCKIQLTLFVFADGTEGLSQIYMTIYFKYILLIMVILSGALTAVLPPFILFLQR